MTITEHPEVLRRLGAVHQEGWDQEEKKMVVIGIENALIVHVNGHMKLELNVRLRAKNAGRVVR